MGDSVLDRTPSPADFRLTYGDVPEQFADLRLPDTGGPFPAIAYIHGGFWRSQYDLQHAGHICAALTAAGYATWNIEYRRIGNDGGGWPGTFQDVAASIRHLLKIAPDYGIDPAKIGVAGHSAGGHLALWASAIGQIPESSPIWSESLPLVCAISLAGVVDLRQAWRLKLSGGVVELLMGGSPEEVPDRYAAASPMELIPLGVPQLLVHGVNDEIVPFALSRAYLRAAQTVGDDAALLALEQTGHFEVIDPESSVWPAIESSIISRFQSVGN